MEHHHEVLHVLLSKPSDTRISIAKNPQCGRQKSCWADLKVEAPLLVGRRFGHVARASECCVVSVCAPPVF